MTPSMGTRNFTDKKIFIEFDEYVQVKDQSKEFFTSPFMKKKPVVTPAAEAFRYPFRTLCSKIRPMR